RACVTVVQGGVAIKDAVQEDGTPVLLTELVHVVVVGLLGQDEPVAGELALEGRLGRRLAVPAVVLQGPLEHVPVLRGIEPPGAHARSASRGQVTLVNDLGDQAPCMVRHYLTPGSHSRPLKPYPCRCSGFASNTDCTLVSTAMCGDSNV